MPLNLSYVWAAALARTESSRLLPPLLSEPDDAVGLPPQAASRQTAVSAVSGTRSRNCMDASPARTGPVGPGSDGRRATSPGCGCDAVNTAVDRRSNHLADRYATVTGPPRRPRRTPGRARLRGRRTVGSRSSTSSDVRATAVGRVTFVVLR